MGLEERDDPARGRQRAVERGDGRGAAVLAAEARAEAASLERGAVRGGGELAVGVLGGDPRLDVVLAGGAGSEVARRRVDDAVGEAEVLHHALLHGEQALVLRLRVGGVDVGEHLELLELVHADDAAGVLAVGDRLLAVPGRPAGVADGALGQVEDLVGVVPGERHLARAREVEVVVVEVVDLVGVGAEEAGAGHDLGLHERGGDERHEARLERAGEAEVHQGDLEPRADALEVVEAGAGDLGSAAHVDGVEDLADLQMVARGEVERGLRADLPYERPVVLTAGGDPVDDDVRDPPHGLVERRLGLLRALLRGGDAGLQLLHLGDEARLVGLVGLRDELAVRVLLGAEALELGDRPAALGVRGDCLVDHLHGCAAQLLRGDDEVGMVAEGLRIDHPVTLTKRIGRVRAGTGRRRRVSRPRLARPRRCRAASRAPRGRRRPRTARGRCWACRRPGGTSRGR